MKKFLKPLAFALATTCIFTSACSCFGGNEQGGNGGGVFADAFPQKSAFTENKTVSIGLNAFVFSTDATLVLTENFTNDDVYNRANKLWSEVVTCLEDVENSLSTAVKTSSIYKFNQADAGETVTIDKMAYDVLSEALRIYNYTDGYYNPGVYYTVDLYGFAPRSTNNKMPYDREIVETLPAEKYVTAFQQLGSHFGEIVLAEKDGEYTATKPKNGFVTVDGVTYTLKVDLGGIGKGYATDLIDDLTEKAGFHYGYFNFGSSSIALNKYNESQAEFKLSSRNPRPLTFNDPGYIKRPVYDVKLSSSGDYEKYYEVDGVRYCHIINPKTGKPTATNVITATVVGRTAVEGDAMTTALICMGKDKAIEFINKNLKDEKVCFAYIAEGGELQIIANFPTSDYEILDSRYTPAYILDEENNIIYNG